MIMDQEQLMRYIRVEYGHTQTRERRRKRARERILKMGNMRVHCKCGCAKYPDSSCRPLGGMVLVAVEIGFQLKKIVLEQEKLADRVARLMILPSVAHSGSLTPVRRREQLGALLQPLLEDISGLCEVECKMKAERQKEEPSIAPRVSIYNKQGFGFLIISSCTLSKSIKRSHNTSVKSEIQVTPQQRMKTEEKQGLECGELAPKRPRIKDEQEEVEVLIHLLHWKLYQKRLQARMIFLGMILSVMISSVKTIFLVTVIWQQHGKIR
ncbi:hypothetical protein F5877DRAFT_69622 [Lentinula edodes]|nr:hypothetical protein F5877DRAFT_69622 [Lentinula edodes]